MRDQPREESVQWLLTEYNSLRHEMTRRSREQFVCISGSIAALGSVMAFISGNPTVYYPLLIVVPWMLAILGLIWTDHGHHIFLLGAYIGERIEPKIAELLEMDGDIGWTRYMDRKRRVWKSKGRLPSFINVMLPFLFFVLPSASCLGGYIAIRFAELTRLPVVLEIKLLAVGLLFITVLVVSWLRTTRAINEQLSQGNGHQMHE